MNEVSWNRAEFQEIGVTSINGLLAIETIDQFKSDLASLVVAAFDSRQSIAAFDKESGGHDRNPVFLNSGDAARVFHEPVANSWDRFPEFPVYSDAVARVGHGLHALSGPVRDWLQTSAVASLFQRSGFLRPAVIESMYVRKSRHSDVLPPHLDHTFLWTDPPSVQVLWIALDHADQMNGGIRADTRGRRSGSNLRLERTGDEAHMVEVHGAQRDSTETNLYDLQAFDCAPGDAVLIDGLVLHGSGSNPDGVGRDALAIHVVDAEAKWRTTNYLGNVSPLYLIGGSH